MGIKTFERQHQFLTPSLSRSVSPFPSARRQASLFAGAVLLLLAVTLIVFLLRPVHVHVAGARHVLPHGSTVEQAALAARCDLSKGDLFDVHGLVLRAKGGAAPVFVCNGLPVPPGTRVRQGDFLAVLPGRDVQEPTRETATLLPAESTHGTGLTRPGVVGVRRVRVGLLSGKTDTEVTRAVATVPAPKGPQPSVVALTFDDGPWPGQTEQILAILRKYKAHATFFMLGNLARAHPNLVRAVHEAGNEVGVHSWSHANYTHLSTAAITADLNRCQAQMQILVGQPVRLMRPPYGAVNASAAAAIKAAGFRIVLWSLDTNDWRRPGENTIYTRLMHARPQSIVLCHDGGGPRSQTIAALARAVPALQAKGYKLGTVSEVLGLRSLPAGGALVAAGRRHQIQEVDAGVGVLVDGEPMPLTETPLEINGQLMLPIKPLLDKLGLQWGWSQKAQKLTVQGPLDTITLRLNDLRLEHQYGDVETLPEPPVMYRGNLMIPLWVLLQAAQATAEYDPSHETLNVFSFKHALTTPRLGHVPPPAQGRGVQWREYLRVTER